MKYKNAQDIFPDELLKEIQNYVEGEMIYVPKMRAKKQWGEESGARSYYKQRNEKIREKYSHGSSLEELATEYALSVDSIRKIVC